MNSFFQFAERAKRHRLMKEVGEAEPVQAANNMAAQNKQVGQSNATPPSNNNATNPPEVNDATLFSQLSDNWKKFYSAQDNKAAFARLQATDLQNSPGVKELNQTLSALSTQLTKLTASMAKPANSTAPAPAANAGSNTAGASAGAKPAAAPAGNQGSMGQ